MAKVVELHGNELGLHEAADYCRSRWGLKLSAKTLSNKMSAGQGPRRTIRFGRVCFTVADLDAWVRSNSEVKAAFSR